MEFSSYVKSLLGINETDKVLEDLRVTRGDLKEITIKLWDQNAKNFPGAKFRNKELIAMVSRFNAMCKPSGGNFFKNVVDGLEEALTNVDTITDQIEREFNNEVANAAMSFRKANLLRFAEALSFVDRYSRSLLNYVLILETGEYEENGTTVKDSMTPAQIQWVVANYNSYLQAFRIVTLKKVEISKRLDSIPEVTVNDESTRMVASVSGMAKLDPFQMGFIPICLNPIYHVGMLVADWQVARHNAAKEERDLIQLRILNLKRSMEGKPDANIQKQIAYNEERLKKLTAKIADMEKEYA